MKREPKCNNPHDHEVYPGSHADNTSTSRWTLWGKECPLHGPNARRAAVKQQCRDCGISYGGHVKGCPQHPDSKKPEPDAYVSPHNVDASREQHTRIPVFDYTEDENGVAYAYQTSERYDYPHRDWVEAREAYAKDPEQHPLDTVLMHVTETNPPPGPPIAVFKPAPVKDPDRARNMFFAAFALLFVMAGLLPFLVTLFG